MKLVNTILIILSFSFCAMAQRPQRTEKTTTVKDTAYINTYNKLRALYLKQLDTDSHKKAQKLTMDFIKKTKFDGDLALIAQEGSMLKWIKENLEKTSFTSYDEAVKEYEEQEAASKEEEKENAEYYAFLKTAIDKYSSKIMADVRLNRGTGEDPKESKEYIAAYEKLKSLLIKQKSSASYLNLESLRRAFYKKSNFDFKKDKLENGASIMSWVKQNLSKTGFTSLSQAEMEWGAVEFAQEAEEKENADFHAFKSEALRKFGPYMYSDVMREVMTEK